MMSDTINELSSNDLIDVLQNFYTEKFNKKGEIKVLSCETKSLSEELCGFLSEHTVLYVNFESNGVKYSATFFVKSVAQSLEKYVKEYGVFEKEIGVCQEIIPKLTSLTSIKWVPVCYLSKKNLIVFENLQDAGFEMVKNHNGLFDVHHQLVAVALIAAMHGSSIVYEKECNKEIKNENWFHLLHENVYPDDPKAMKSKVHNHTVNTLAELLMHIPKYVNRINEILPDFRQLMQRMKDFVKPSNKYRNVFSHGDLWGNNIMFKYATLSNGIDINDRIPVAAMLVDFQLARHAPPALDLMVMLTITSTSEFRQRYLTRVCDAYYDHLKFELRNHCIEIEREYPRQQFDESCTFYRMVGLMESCLFSHLTLLPTKLVLAKTNDPDTRNNFMMKSKTDVCLQAFKTNENYRNRMTDMLVELVDEYVLPKLP